jgi:hypothetical protein
MPWHEGAIAKRSECSAATAIPAKRLGAARVAFFDEPPTLTNRKNKRKQSPTLQFLSS